MTYHTEKRKLRKNEHEFLTGVARLAQQHALSPHDALPLLGHLARLAAQSAHMRQGIDLGEATVTALELILAGCGAVAEKIVLVVPPTPPSEATH